LTLYNIIITIIDALLVFDFCENHVIYKRILDQSVQELLHIQWLPYEDVRDCCLLKFLQCSWT